jgi:Domain of unknown function (DUF5597)/Beta-galactosidase
MNQRRLSMKALIASVGAALLLPCIAAPTSSAGQSKPSVLQAQGVTLRPTAPPEALPRLQRAASTTQFLVNGKPWIALAGEVHNSTASSEAYMRPVWDRLQQLHLNTVVTPAYWELVEPKEGQYDFSLVDMQIREARARKMRIVLLWFGAIKNAKSNYAPAWVREDKLRFPRALTSPSAPKPIKYEPALSVFSNSVVQADARAFGQLMAHLAKFDQQRTVIAVQVENEAGVLGDSRDRSPAAEAAWKSAVPSDLMAYLKSRKGQLEPSLDAVWARQGYRESGDWEQVFGNDWQAEELFMAWGVSRFINHVAEAGKSQLRLPMYANAWLGPQQKSDRAGSYPSGGPIPRVFDIWRAGAPAIDWLSPDIYVDDFKAWSAAYARKDNPLFVPEARFIVGNLFITIGQHRGFGFAPFGIEDGLPGNQIAEAYKALGGMGSLLADAQAAGRIDGFALDAGETRQLDMGDYQIRIRGGRDTMRKMFLDMGIPVPVITPPPVPQNTGTTSHEVSDQRPLGLILQLARDEFLLVGKDLDVEFTLKSRPNEPVELARIEEGRYVDGRWVPGRVLNGDEALRIVPFDELGSTRIQLLRMR